MKFETKYIIEFVPFELSKEIGRLAEQDWNCDLFVSGGILQLRVQGGTGQTVVWDYAILLIPS